MASNTMISWKPKNVMRHLPWRLDSQGAIGFLLILATFSLVGWLYLTQASSVTATSYRIDELRMELTQIENQNAAIALDIAELQALARVEERALALGLRPTTDVRYLAVPNYPAAVEVEDSYDYTVQIREAIEADARADNPTIWWERALDALTAWMVGEPDV